MTELYLINDDSANKKETWVFLDRRMEEGILIQQTLDMGEATSKNMAKALASTFSTVGILSQVQSTSPKNLLFHICYMKLKQIRFFTAFGFV